MRMQRRWRAWLTEHTITRWLAKGATTSSTDRGRPQEPGSAHREDIRIATEQPVDFAVGI
jgi:putative ATP-binding cassette transporter